MIATALLVSLALTQTAHRLVSPAPPGEFAAIIGDRVEVRFGDNFNPPWCVWKYDTNTGMVEMPCVLHPTTVNSSSENTGSMTAASLLVSGPTQLGSVTATTANVSSLMLAPQTLPTCASTNLGTVAYSSADGAFYGCGAAGWVALTNPAPNPNTLATKQATFTPPTSLGVLGVGNTSSWTVSSAGVPVGSDCLITCPQSLVGKVVWSCDVPAAGQFRAIGTATTALSITLPSGSCSMRALWLETSTPGLRLPTDADSR